jgi:hypothetical protein
VTATFSPRFGLSHRKNGFLLFVHKDLSGVDDGGLWIGSPDPPHCGSGNFFILSLLEGWGLKGSGRIECFRFWKTWRSFLNYALTRKRARNGI